MQASRDLVKPVTIPKNGEENSSGSEFYTYRYSQARRQEFEWAGAFEWQSWGRTSAEAASY